MTNKTNLVLATAIALTILIPASGFGQNMGLQIGVAQGQFGHHPGPPMVGPPNGAFLPPVQPPAIATRGTVVARLSPFPIPPPPLPTITTTPFPLIPNFPTVITPNTVIISGPTVLPVGPFVATTPQVFYPTNPFAQPGLPPLSPSLPFNPTGPATLPMPPIGTPRADVLRQFGAPSVTILTRTGETLYFPGGATVIIENGYVVGPR